MMVIGIVNGPLPRALHGMMVIGIAMMVIGIVNGPLPMALHLRGDVITWEHESLFY
jgi:hypothetical protein